MSPSFNRLLVGHVGASTTGLGRDPVSGVTGAGRNDQCRRRRFVCDSGQHRIQRGGLLRGLGDDVLGGESRGWIRPVRGREAWHVLSGLAGGGIAIQPPRWDDEDKRQRERDGETPGTLGSVSMSGPGRSTLSGSLNVGALDPDGWSMGPEQPDHTSARGVGPLYVRSATNTNITAGAGISSISASGVTRTPRGRRNSRIGTISLNGSSNLDVKDTRSIGDGHDHGRMGSAPADPFG